MKIKEIEIKTITMPYDIPMTIALGVEEGAVEVLVRITTDDGLCGFGEASPFEPVTGESVRTVIAALEQFRPALIGMEATDLEGVHAVMDRMLAYNSSAKCAIDIALYDIIGKAAGLPLYKLLGGSVPSAESDITLGIDDPKEMAKLAKKYAEQGYRIIKVKTGINPEEDLEAVRLIREAVGPNVHLRIDANQGYDLCTAYRVLEEMKALGVEEAEQPLPWWNVDGMAELRRQLHGIKLMADESVHDLHDAMRVIKAGAADVINIKLMKSGGIYPALKICAAAEAAGIPCMVGCMDDSKIALTAALSLVVARNNIKDADLDSYLFYKDPEMGMKGGFTRDGAMYTLTDRPGLGIEFDFDAI